MKQNVKYVNEAKRQIQEQNKTANTETKKRKERWLRLTVWQVSFCNCTKRIWEKAQEM